MKRFLSVLLAAVMLLPMAACGSSAANEFAAYKQEQDAILKEKLSAATTNAETLIIWNAQEQLRNTEYDGAKSLEENKQTVDTLMEAALRELAYETAEIGDYTANGLFMEDYAVSLVTDEDGGGYTTVTQLVFDWLVSDGSIKKQLGGVTAVCEIFDSSVLFFRADGSFALENHYAQLMQDTRRSILSSAADTDIEKEIVTGTYEVAMEPNEDGLYSILVTKSDGSTIEFWLNPKGGDILGQQIFTHETYERRSDIAMPEKTISDYLTTEGYLKKNSVEGAKADYHTELNGSVVFTDAVQEKINALTDETLKRDLEKVAAAGDLYCESVASFTETGKAVITNHYTELGTQLMQALGLDAPQTVTGTYTVSQTPEEGTTKHRIEVAAQDETVVFFLDTVSGQITRQELFREEAFAIFTTDELLSGSGAGYAEESWTDADGTILTDISYGDGQRNLLDVYIPANYDPSNDNGVILFIHGGSWTGGGKEDVANLCKQYAKLGYFTAAMSHTYAMTDLADGSKSTLLTINSEVGMVFAKLKELSDEKGWNLTQAAVSGYSSGCHIAYLYAYSNGNEPDAPIPVKAAFGMVGCMDFRAEYWRNVQTDGPGVAALGLNDERIISTDDPYSEEEYNALMDSISPLAFAKRGDAVPSVVAYAMLDETLIDWYNGVALQEALNLYSIPNELFLLPNCGHVCGNNAAMVREYNDVMLSYLKTCFGY